MAHPVGSVTHDQGRYAEARRTRVLKGGGGMNQAQLLLPGHLLKEFVGGRITHFSTLILTRGARTP